MTNYVITYRCDIKCQLYRCALSGAEQAIAGIPEPRQDVTVVVELAVERGGEDGDVGVGLEHAAHALGRRDETQEADALGASVLERAHGIRRRAAGREHGIEHEEIARVLAGRDLEIVVHRLERVVLAVDTDVADACRGDELRDTLDHAEPRAQDRHEGELLPGHPDSPHPLERRFHLRGLERQVLGHLVRHEHGDLVHELLEVPGGGVLVPENRELVLDQRVIEHREVREVGVRHGREGIARDGETSRRRPLTGKIQSPRRIGRPGWAATDALFRTTNTPCTSTWTIPSENWDGRSYVARSTTRAASNTVRSASAPTWTRPLARIAGTTRSSRWAGSRVILRTASWRLSAPESRT